MAQEFLQPREGLLLVDSLNFCFRYKQRKGTYAADFIRDIRGFAASFKCREVIILSDRYGSKYRKELYPEYKANRKKINQSEEDKADFKEFIEEYNRTLEMCKELFKVVILEGVEADDVIAYLCNTKAREFKHLMILSTDKDLNQLVTHKVSRFSYITRKETNMDNFEEQNNCLPEEFILVKCLQGDTGDNIPGVAGIGAKRACNLVRDCPDIQILIESLPLEGKQKFIQNLNNSRELLELNYKLMDLTEHVILTEEEIQHIEDIYATN